MNHEHIHLHWNKDHHAECVICGYVHGKRYFPQLTGYFSISDYDKYDKNIIDISHTVAQTFTLPERYFHEI